MEMLIIRNVHSPYSFGEEFVVQYDRAEFVHIVLPPSMSSSHVCLETLVGEILDRHQPRRKLLQSSPFSSSSSSSACMSPCLGGCHKPMMTSRPIPPSAAYPRFLPRGACRQPFCFVIAHYRGPNIPTAKELLETRQQKYTYIIPPMMSEPQSPTKSTSSSESGEMALVMSPTAAQPQKRQHYNCATRPSCDHEAHWKQMRVKKGIGQFRCLLCGCKWRDLARSVKFGAAPSRSDSSHQRSFEDGEGEEEENLDDEADGQQQNSAKARFEQDPVEAAENGEN